MAAVISAVRYRENAAACRSFYLTVLSAASTKELVKYDETLVTTRVY
jgi:hypothetical protein